MKRKLVIYLIGSTFNSRHAERIGLDHYKSVGIDFMVWECLFERLLRRQDIKENQGSCLNVRRITSITSIISALDSLDGRGAIFIDSLGVDLNSRITRILIKRRGFGLGLLRIQHLLEPRGKLYFIQALKKISSVQGFLVRLSNLILKIIFPKQRYDFLIFAGSAGRIDGIHNGIETCSYDVATFNCSDPTVFPRSSVEDSRYIVFLDNGSYVHPDSDECSLYIKGGLEEFTKKLKAFFSNLERQTGAKIIIAAHPKVPTQHYQEFYKDFRVEFGKTASLVKGAVATCMVQSNSMAFAVLSKRPIIIVTDKNHSQSYIGDYQKRTAEFLGLKIIDLDKENGIGRIPNICADSYDKYVEKYLATSSFVTSKSVWTPLSNAIIRNFI